MKYNLISIFENIATATINEEDCDFSIKELWEWTVFDNVNCYLNKSLEIHLPSGIAVKERKIKLEKIIEIEGDYLLFDFIGHCPSYKLIRLEKIQDLANLMLSHSGIFNSFTTIQIPIIKGGIYYSKELRKMNFYPNKSERELIDDFQKVLNTEINDSTFSNCLKQGRDCVIKHKENGINQQRAYDVIFVIKLVYVI